MQRAARGKVDHPLLGVERVQEALNGCYDLDIAANGTWGASTADGYRHHQRKIGNSPEFVDGVPGPKDLAALGAGRFVVTE